MKELFEEYCHTHGLWLVETDRHTSICFTKICFVKGTNLLVEVDVSSVDWGVTVWDASNGAELCSEWYDVYDHARESGGDVSLQSQKSIEEFLDLVLASDIRVTEGPAFTLFGRQFGKARFLQHRVGQEWLPFAIFGPSDDRASR